MGIDCDIVIAGGALNGSALALACASAGMSVTVVDPVSSDTQGAEDFDGRGYALALTSQRLLQAIGVWGAVADHAQPLLEIKVSDGRAGEGASPFVLEFDHAEIEEGPMGYMVEDRYLRRALQGAMAEHSAISVVSDDMVVAQSVGPGSLGAELRSGRTINARVLAGCDGRKSKTAERAGIKRTGWDYGQTALVCAINHAKPHHGIAHQFFMPPGPLAILPLPGNQCSIVWTESHAEAARINGLSDAEYLKVLRPRFGDFLGEISLAGGRFTYPLNLTLANSFVAERVALVGDAAHGMHPIAGQGLNAGLKDVAALAEVLAGAKRRGEDIGTAAVLARYQRWRRFDVATLAAATDSINRLFSNDNSIVRLGRDIGLGVVNALPGLRRSFIREAAGLAGDLPKLLQGRAI
jgi:2-octaprenyl-6-methoxyphenol hydroxylase